MVKKRLAATYYKRVFLAPRLRLGEMRPSEAQ